MAKNTRDILASISYLGIMAIGIYVLFFAPIPVLALFPLPGALIAIGLLGFWRNLK